MPAKDDKSRDPGLDAAREVLKDLVLGIAEAAFHMASMISGGFSVVTTLTRTSRMTGHLLNKYEVDHSRHVVHGTDSLAAASTS